MEIFKKSVVFVLCVEVLVTCSSKDVTVKFLKDFFATNNVAFTVQNCWSKSSIKNLVKETANIRAVGFTKNTNVERLKKWSNNDYLVLDLRHCDSTNSLLFQLNATNTFVYPLKYLLITDKSEFLTLSEKLNQYQILPNCELVIAVFNNESAFLYQPYKVGNLNELTWEKYGHWSLKKGLTENFKNIPTSQRRMNLKGANLAVCLAIFNNDTWNHLTTDYKNPEIDPWTKQDYEPALCMLQHMQVNHSLVVVDNLGYLDHKTGVFSGLVHEIQTGRADVSANSIFFTDERYSAVDLIKQGTPHSIRFIVRKPATSFIKNIFFITLNLKVWIASIVILVIFACVIIVVLNWEVKHKKKVRQNKFSVSDVTLIAFEAVCQQGSVTEPQSFAGRILALILFGAFMFIYVSYSANIVVLLQSTTKINSIQELLDSRIEVGGEQIHYMRHYFEAVKKGPLKQLYDKKIYPDRYFPVEKGMKKVQDGNFAFHVALQSAYVYVLKHFTNHEICGLQELPGYIEEDLGYLAVRKHSPYKDLIKVAILKVDEYGLRKRTLIRVIRKPKCYSQSASFKSIGFVDCEQVLYIFLFGLIFSLLIFVVECLIHHFMTHINWVGLRSKRSL